LVSGYAHVFALVNPLQLNWTHFLTECAQHLNHANVSTEPTILHWPHVAKLINCKWLQTSKIYAWSSQSQ